MKDIKASKKKSTIDAANSTLVGRVNRNSVLNLIRNTSFVSRTEIWRRTGLSRAAVTGIIRSLKNINLIEEVGDDKSTGGRRPELLRFKPEAFWIVAVDLFGKLVTITDLSSNIKIEMKVELNSNEEPEVSLKKIVDVINEALGKISIDKSKVLGIGIALPGEVDYENGVLVFSSELNWHDIPVKSIIEEATGLATLVDNDVRMRALGEHLFGIGRNVNNLVCIEVSETSIGAACILNGRLFRGEHNSMGEIGHIPIVRDGPQCNCGNRGCLEKYASGVAIVSRIKDAIRAGRKTAISDLANGTPESIMIEHLFEAAGSGDTFAVQVMNDLVYYLGLGVAIMINSLDPRMVVLCGSLIEKGGDSLLGAVRESAMEKVLNPSARNVKIERTSLGEKAGIIGACGLVYESVFKMPMLHT